MRIGRLIESYYFKLFYLIVSRGHIRCRLRRPHIISGKNIKISRHAYIEKGAWIVSQENSEGIHIKSGCMIHRNLHVDSSVGVVIDHDVLIAEGVYISDNTHSYSDISKPIKHQAIRLLKKTVIGSGTWIGQDAKIIGVEIGRNCVIGANCLVNNDIPDYCVVVGTPARIIKRYNLKTNEWEKIY